MRRCIIPYRQFNWIAYQYQQREHFNLELNLSEWLYLPSVDSFSRLIYVARSDVKYCIISIIPNKIFCIPNTRQRYNVKENITNCVAVWVRWESSHIEGWFWQQISTRFVNVNRFTEHEYLVISLECIYVSPHFYFQVLASPYQRHGEDQWHVWNSRHVIGTLKYIFHLK